MQCQQCNADVPTGNDHCAVCGMAVPSDQWLGASAPMTAPPQPPDQFGVAGTWPPVGTQPGGPPPGYAPVSQPGYPYGVPPGGAPYGFYPGALPMSTNGLAIASMVCGIVGGFACIAWIPAIVMGFIALNQIKATDNRQPGRGMAIAGIVTGVIWLVLIVAYFLFIIFFLGHTSPQ